MSESRVPSQLRSVFGVVMLLVGLSVFAIRLQHAGPYGLPRGGNGLAAVLAILLGLWLVRPWLGSHALAKPLTWVALAVGPFVLFFALYATLAELEEVVVLTAQDRSGDEAQLRLWIIDIDDAAWVQMPRSKADAHGLGQEEAELLRQGITTCVNARRFEDRETANSVHVARGHKYAVQRLATSLGLFGETAHESTIALRLDPCPGS